MNMYQDSVIPVQNILTITFATLVLVTYIETAIDGLRDMYNERRLFQLQAMGLGLVILALGTIQIRLYSFGIRELGWDWLRYSIIPILGIGAQGVGFVILGVGFFLPRHSGAPPMYSGKTRLLRRGIFFSGVVFLVLTAVKIMF